MVDATGVGTPVVDVLRTANVQAELVAVYFNYGDKRTEINGEVRLGKAFLVSRLQAALQAGRLHLPKTAEARTLSEELLDYEIRVDENANDKYGAFRVGCHDDLVTALGLAVQADSPTSFTLDLNDPADRRFLTGFGSKGWGFGEDRHGEGIRIGGSRLSDAAGLAGLRRRYE